MSDDVTTQILVDVLTEVGLPRDKASDVRFIGNEPVYCTQFKVATAGAASLGAMAIAMADIREAQTGKRPSIAIDVRGATASLRSSKYVRVDGKGPAERTAVSGYYRAANERWNYFHCNHPPHQLALLKVLGVPADKAKVAEASAKWDAFKLEDAVREAGGLAPAVRTRQEWDALPNTPALKGEPLVDIRKIGDCPPVPLPDGNGERPLSGLRVLDLTRVLAGPTCARMLAEAGADVLKITCERHPDSPFHEWDTGYRKRKATLDIATPAGKEQFANLMKSCDVISQAYRPGALTNLGFGPEQAMKLRPGIIYASLNAFGHTGEWKMRRGFDTVVQAASGMAIVSGRSGDPKMTPVSALDYITGYLFAFGVLVALKRRHEVGGSYAVNVSLARCQEWLVSMGLHDKGVADSAFEELPEIASWLTEVETPLGVLRRLRPVVQYSDESMNQLVSWPSSGKTGAVWS